MGSDGHPRVSRDHCGTAMPNEHLIRLIQTGEVYSCSELESLLQGMVRIGRKGIPAGCLNGGCGVCKIKVSAGSVRCVGAMSRAHVSADEEIQGICLACRVAPLGSVDIEVVGKMKKVWGGQWASPPHEKASKHRAGSTKE